MHWLGTILLAAALGRGHDSAGPLAAVSGPGVLAAEAPAETDSWAPHRATRVRYAGYEGGSRWESFERFLRGWFDEVGTIQLGKLDEKTAADYDVVITDWTSHYGNDGYRDPAPPIPTRLSSDFTKPVIAVDYTGEFALIGPLIDSSLGVTPARRHQLWTDPAVRYLGRDNFATYLATADTWPSPDVGDDFRTPVLCDIPVVFAQGDWDTSTPIENTFEIAPFFPNGRVLIAEQGGHGVLEPIGRQAPDVWETLEHFLRTGDASRVPPRVQLEPTQGFVRPRFPLEE